MRIIAGSGQIPSGIPAKINLFTHTNKAGKEVASILKAGADNKDLGLIRQGFFRGGPVNSPLALVPHISLTQLLADPQAYIRRKMRIAERMVRWRAKQTALRLLESINEEERKITRSESSIQYAEEMQKLIENGAIQESQARYYDMLSRPVNDFLRLGIRSETSPSGVLEFVDRHAIISVDQSKNILLTKVVGRDKTRKEYISGGDYMVKISGKVVSGFPDVYPTEEMAKLIEVVNYKGTIECKSYFLDHFGIDGLIVLNYSFPQESGCRNVQSYTLNCVFEKSIEALVYEEKEIETRVKATIEATNDWISIGDVVDKFNPLTYFQKHKWL